MRKKIASKYGPDKVYEIRRMFEAKKWDDFEEFEHFFDNFCAITEILNDEQTNLVLDLTEDFLWIKENSYSYHLKKALGKLDEYPRLNIDTIYIVPMLSKNARAQNKTKSSSLVAYLLKGMMLKFNMKFKDTTFKIIDDIRHLPKKNRVEQHKNPILLVDDYIGTGDTAIEALEEILDIRKYSKNTLFVFSLVCQSQGLSAINNRGFNVLTDIIRNKGISDNPSNAEASERKRIMSSIEDMLAEDPGFNHDYKFGYKSSEALVSMIRTPNNTFPLYWFNANINDGKKWNSPFPR